MGSSYHFNVMLYYSYYYFWKLFPEEEAYNEKISDFLFEGLIRFWKTHQCTAGFLGRKLKWSVSSPWLWKCTFSREWVFRALQGQLITKEVKDPIVSQHEGYQAHVKNTPFEKWRYYPNSCSVLILQSHSREKWSYCGRGQPQRGYLHLCHHRLIMAHCISPS